MICEFEKVHEVAKQDGLKLSPVNLHINSAVSINLSPLKWVNYNVPAKKMKVTNSGFTAILSGKWNQERPFVYNGPLNGNYVFSQVHFHWGENNHTGSEHAVEGMRYPLEMHVVHFKSDYMSQDVALKKKDGVIIMVHLFAIQEEKNVEMDQLTAVLQFVQKANSSAKLCSALLSKIVYTFDSDYFLYWGSVSSAVGLHQILWFVSRRVLPISTYQLDQFRSLHNMQKQPLLRNYSEPCDLKGRTLFLISPSPIGTTVYGVSHTQDKILQQKSQTLDDQNVRLDVNSYAEYKSLTGIKVFNSDIIDIDTDLQRSEDSGVPDCTSGRETNIANSVIQNNCANNNRLFQVYTQGSIHYFRNPLSEANSKYVKNNINAWENDDRRFSPQKNTLSKKKVRITENDTSIEELCYDLNSNFSAEYSVGNSLYEETASFSSQYESTSSISYQRTERSSESHSGSYRIPSNINKEYRFTMGDISFNMYGNSPKTKQQPISQRQRETIFNTDTSVEETCISLGTEPPGEPNTSQLNLQSNLLNQNCLSKKTKKTYLPPLPDTTGSAEMNVLSNDASLIKTGSSQNQPILKTTVNKTFEIPIELINNTLLDSDKTKLFDKFHALSNGDNFQDSLLVSKREVETEPNYHSKREYQYSDSKYECVEYINSIGSTVTTYKHTNIENKQFTETTIMGQSEQPKIVKEIVTPNVLTETKMPLKSDLNEHEKKGVIRLEELKQPSTVYMDKFLKTKDLQTKFKTGVLRLNPEVEIHISEEVLKPFSETALTEFKKIPLCKRNNQEPQAYDSSLNINATSHQPEKVLEIAPTKAIMEPDGDSVSHETTSESHSAFQNSVQNSENTDDFSEDNGEKEEKDTDAYNNSEFDLRSEVVVELQKTDAVPQKKSTRYNVQLEDEPFSHISNITPLPGVDFKSDVKRIIKNMEDISGNELRACEESVEIEESISKIKAYIYKNDFNKPQQITKTTHMSEKGYDLNLVKLAENMSVHDVQEEEIQKKSIPDKSIKSTASKQEIELLSTKPVKSLKAQNNKQQVFKSDPVAKKSLGEKIKPHMSPIKRGAINGNKPLVVLEKQKTDISRSLKRGITKLSDPSTVHLTGHVRKEETLSSTDLKTRYLSTREKKGANDMNIAEHQNLHFSHKHYRKQIHKSKTETTDPIKYFDTHGVKQHSGIPNLKKQPGIISGKADVSNLQAKHVFKNDEISSFERVIIPIPHPPKYLETPVFDVTTQQQPSKEREFTQAIVGAEVLATSFPSQQPMKEIIVHPPDYPFSSDSLLPSMKQRPCLCNITNRQPNKVDATTSIGQLTTDAQKMLTFNEHQPVLEPQIFFAPTTQLDIPIYDNSQSKPTVFHIELNEPKVCIVNRRSATELSPIQLQCRPILSRELHQLLFPQKYAAKSQLSERKELISKCVHDKKNAEKIKAADKPVMIKGLIDKSNDDLPNSEQHKLMPYTPKEDEQMYKNYLNRVETKTDIIGKPYEANANQCECQCLIKSLDGKYYKLVPPLPEESKQTQTNDLNKAEIEKDLTGKPIDKMLNDEQHKHKLHITEEKKQMRTSNLDSVGTNTKFSDKPYEANINQCQCQCCMKSMDGNQVQKVKNIETDYLSGPVGKKDLNSKYNEDIPRDEQYEIVPSDPKEVQLISDPKSTSITNHTTKHKETKTETVSKCDITRTEEMRDNQILKREVVTKFDTTKTEVKSRDEKTEITRRSGTGAEEGSVFLSTLKQPLTDTRIKKDVEKYNTTVNPGSKMYGTNESRIPNSQYDRIKFPETHMHSVNLRTPGALRQQLLNGKVTFKNEVHVEEKKTSLNKPAVYENNETILEDAKNILDSICTKAENIADNKKQNNLITVNKEEQNRQVTTQPHSQVKVISEDVADNNDDAVVIYIRQAKTSTKHIQPLITVDLSKRKQMSSSEVAIQSIDLNEIDPEYEGVIRRQSVAFRNNELQRTDVKFGSTDPAFKYWPKKPLERFYGFQSPIQIHKASIPRLDLPKLQFFGHWTCQGLALIENIGTTVRLNFELESPGSKPYLRGGPLNDDYEFDHLHFHWAKPDYRGTEHLIGDDGGCGEAHFVYFKKSYRTFREALQHYDGIAMIAIRLKQGGKTSPALERLIKYVEQVQEFDTYVSIEPCDIFLWIRPLVTSTTRGYYTFPGSFTMEPFKEVVTWILYVDSVTICCQDMAAFHQLINSNGQPIFNCRELQMIKNRPIYRVY